jgi:hypothetical protein
MGYFVVLLRFALLTTTYVAILQNREHMREAWRELMFADLDQEAKAIRDPVAHSLRSIK